MVNQIMPQNTNVEQEFGCVYRMQKLNTKNEWEMITQC